MGRKRKMKRGKVNAKRRNEDSRPNYKDIVKENESFEHYYKAQKICSEEEMKAMLDTLRLNLPTGFRITSYPKYEAQGLLSVVESTFFKDLLKVDEQNEEAAPKPFPLPWYPDRLGWQIQITRNDIRKSEAYFRLHNFLISETQGGNISRQEVVSMIPPILLDVQSHHKVLDMCAAPGSKTAQLIEQLHSTSEDELPSGVVVANDIDNKRCYMLVHQAKRLNSPCAIITNHDAAVMPNLFRDNGDGTTSVLKFDRVLCDVPCSGDGTLRKNPDIWLKWNAANGSNMHGVQIRILKRGLEMLEIGGKLVYSTCSLNPIENEAVIHRLLVEAKDSVKIVDVESRLPGLKYRPGLSHWLPASKDLQFYETFEDVPERSRTVLRPQMFPPKPEEAAQFNLDKCIRILPHYQDTGGFFVTVLEKLKPLPWEAQTAVTGTVSPEAGENENGTVVEDTTQSERKCPRKKIKLGYKEDPFVFFENDEPVWTSVKDFYEVQTNDILPSCLLTRCLKGKKKNIYLCSPLVRSLLSANQDRIKIINSGVRVFVRCDKKAMGCAFRLAQEGVINIQSFFGDARIVRVCKDDFVKILLHNNPTSPLTITELSPETQERVKDFTVGSCIIQLLDEKFPIRVVGWRGSCSLRAYIAVPDGVHYLRVLGEDVSAFDVNKFRRSELKGEEKSVDDDVVDEEKSMVDDVVDEEKSMVDDVVDEEMKS